jgi:hypothetical protein
MTRKTPVVVECANCGRRLDPNEYRVPLNKNTSEERVHRIVAPTYPPFAILCPCGHYSVFTSDEEKSNT